MRSRPRALTLALSLVAGVLWGTALPASAATGDRLSLTFDTGPAMGPGAEVRGTPRRASGTVLTDGTARIKRSSGATGRAARFPCLACGRAIIEVPDRNSLDPRDAAFSFGASVRITARQAAGSMNVLQKGWYDEFGGQYKLQVDDGRPSCVVNGSTGRAVVLSTVDVADGAWHAVACQRAGSTVSVLVDGGLVAQSQVETGNVSNGAPVWIGGKEIGTSDPDQFRGRMDDVFVRIIR